MSTAAVGRAAGAGAATSPPSRPFSMRSFFDLFLVFLGVAVCVCAWVEGMTFLQPVVSAAAAAASGAGNRAQLARGHPAKGREKAASSGKRLCCMCSTLLLARARRRRRSPLCSRLLFLVLRRATRRKKKSKRRFCGGGAAAERTTRAQQKSAAAKKNTQRRLDFTPQGARGGERERRATAAKCMQSVCGKIIPVRLLSSLPPYKAADTLRRRRTRGVPGTREELVVVVDCLFCVRVALCSSL